MVRVGVGMGGGGGGGGGVSRENSASLISGENLREKSQNLCLEQPIRRRSSGARKMPENTHPDENQTKRFGFFCV
jgi:hypothetical protein